MTRTDWVVIGMKLHAEFQGATEGFQIWQDWSRGAYHHRAEVKWDDEARNQMLPIWKGFRLEGRPLATLEREVREVPAAADEFPVVPVAQVEPLNAPAPGDAVAVDAEVAWVRETRELLEKHVIMQTGGGKRFFLLAGHPRPEISRAAGLAGQEMTSDQLDHIFGSHLPPAPAGKGMRPQDASAVMKRAPWRKTVHRVGFHPGGAESYVELDGFTYLNAYKSIPIEPVRPREHQIEPLKWLLRRILDDQDKPTGGVYAQWLLRLYAYCLQKPGIKVKWAPILYSSTQGTGKTTLMQTLPSLLFGRQYVSSMVHTVLRERFAGANFDSTWWVCLAEMKSDAGKVDAKTIANKLKPWITDDSIQIEKKGVDSYEIRNHLQLTAMSNHRDALFIDEGEKDRRWLVGQIKEEALSASEKSMLNPLFGGDEIRDPKAVNWLHWYFLNEVKLDGFNPNDTPPETIAKSRMREESRSAWEDEVFEAIFHKAHPFDKELVTPTDITKSLLMGRNLSISQAKALLEKAGCKELPRRFSFARSVYAVRNFPKWSRAEPAQVSKHMLTGADIGDIDDGSDLL